MSISARTMATAKRSLPTVQFRAPDLFGRHVAVLAFQRAGLGLGLALLRVSDSEVAQFYVTALGDETRWREKCSR